MNALLALFSGAPAGSAGKVGLPVGSTPTVEGEGEMNFDTALLAALQMVGPTTQATPSQAMPLAADGITPLADARVSVVAAEASTPLAQGRSSVVADSIPLAASPGSDVAVANVESPKVEPSVVSQFDVATQRHDGQGVVVEPPPLPDDRGTAVTVANVAHAAKSSEEAIDTATRAPSVRPTEPPPSLVRSVGPNTDNKDLKYPVLSSPPGATPPEPTLSRSEEPTTSLPRMVSPPTSEEVLPRETTAALPIERAVLTTVEARPSEPGERPVVETSDSTVIRAVFTQAEPAVPHEAKPVQAPPVPLPAEQIAAPIVTHARLIEHGRSTEFIMELQPPELGSVRVHLSATPEGLTAHLVVADEAVRQLVEGQLNDLRQRLVEASCHVVGFTISDSRGDQNYSGNRQRGHKMEEGDEARPSYGWRSYSGEGSALGAVAPGRSRRDHLSRQLDVMV
jgi:hypothetical protein